MRQGLWFLAALLALSACSSQGAATVAAKSGGCQVDATKICQQVRDKPISMAGYQTDNPMVEQNTPATMTVGVPINGPDGSVIAEVNCFINTRHRSVVYARGTKAPETERDVDYARSAGICSN